MTPTAYHKWLMKVSGGSVAAIADLIRWEVKYNRNPQAFELLEATGDKPFTDATFVKAAEAVVRAVKNES